MIASLLIYRLRPYDTSCTCCLLPADFLSVAHLFECVADRAVGGHTLGQSGQSIFTPNCSPTIKELIAGDQRAGRQPCDERSPLWMEAQASIHQVVLLGPGVFGIYAP